MSKFNIYVEPIEIIRDRIEHAFNSGVFALTFPVDFDEELKKSFIRVGNKTEVSGNDQLPSVVIKFTGAEEEISCINNNLKPLTAEINIEITIIYPIPDIEVINRYYSLTGETGILYFIPDLLDKIMTDYNGGLIDPRFEQNSSRSARFVIGEIEPMGIDKQKCTIECSFKSKYFAINNRVEFSS